MMEITIFHCPPNQRKSPAEEILMRNDTTGREFIYGPNVDMQIQEVLQNLDLCREIYIEVKDGDPYIPPRDALQVWFNPSTADYEWLGRNKVNISPHGSEDSWKYYSDFHRRFYTALDGFRNSDSVRTRAQEKKLCEEANNDTRAPWE